MNDKSVLFEIKYALSLKIYSNLSFRLEMNEHIWATSLVIKREKEKQFFFFLISQIYVAIDIYIDIHIIYIYTSVNPDIFNLCSLFNIVVTILLWFHL